MLRSTTVDPVATQRKNLHSSVNYGRIYPLKQISVPKRKGGTAMQNSTTIQNRIMKLAIKGMSLPVNGR